MPHLKVLICGAGIAGNALAFWLAKAGHDVTVIERYPELRVSGLQLDVRGHGIPVMKRMGLEQAVREKCVDEHGIQIVDSSGGVWGFFPANKTGEGVQGFTSEFEIMRGDLCRIMYDATRDRAKYVFGTTVESYEETSHGVEVRYANGTTEQFDLMVGADGQKSRTRRMMIGSGHENAIEFLGECIAYFTIPREEQKGEKWVGKGYWTTGGRIMLTRRHNPHQLQVYLLCNGQGLENVKKGDVAAEKDAMAKLFRGAGWEADGILKSMLDAEDFYCEHLGVVRLPSWSNGNVVLVGDAGHCTPANGLGVTASLVGAYILAGEIEKHCGTFGTKEDLSTALKSYDEKFRPYISHAQKGVSSKKGWLSVVWEKITNTQLGVGLIYALVAFASFARLDRVLGFLMLENIKGWSLPDYSGILHEQRRE